MRLCPYGPGQYGQSTCCALPVVFVVFVVVKETIFYARHNIIKSVAL